MTTDSLETRIKRQEDIEAIKNLTARYSFGSTRGGTGRRFKWKPCRSFSPQDARWESKSMRVVAEGRDEIMKALKELAEHTDFSMHSYTNPILDVHEDRATGNWLFWIASRRNGGPPNEVFMSEDIAYLRTPEGWRIQRVDVHFGMMLNNKQQLP